MPDDTAGQPPVAPRPPGAGRRPRGPRPETIARREEILRAAARVFGAKGYHQGSLAEVAEQVGITHAGVLHHFGSKDRLLTAVLEHRDRSDVEHLDPQHIPEGLDLFRHLVATAAANAERPGLVQTYTVLTGESVTDGHPAAPWVAERFRVLRADIATALRAVAGTDVDLDAAALDRAASSIIAVMDGLQVQWLLAPDAVDLARSTAFAVEAILAATLAGADRPRPLG
ncbi:TetR/AcrR family transcriptional regulator [Cellulosimicrobium marinum]|uniref:TetR/AcrR family transcriptional regulator n=1 Tax=Cellulosimicrobium marinum TaxID=1638992 RepID=UPI001E5FEFFA|nr:TetR/AcrR family transcriptional regulator [Cellulosimicrobium marinum]MCB7135270.1 TetR/AcrR family transcriptional regulator [Cellulosimicrobium marinum]